MKTKEEKLKAIAMELANLAHMPYCWENVLDRLKRGERLPFKFEKKN